MIQTQTLSFDNTTRRRLIDLSKAIEQNRHNPDALVKLIAAHDELSKRGTLAVYDPREEAKWL